MKGGSTRNVIHSRTWIVSTLSREGGIGTHYQRYLLSKVLSMGLHEVGTAT